MVSTSASICGPAKFSSFPAQTRLTHLVYLVLRLSLTQDALWIQQEDDEWRMETAQCRNNGTKKEEKRGTFSTRHKSTLVGAREATQAAASEMDRGSVLNLKTEHGWRQSDETAHQ